MRLQQLTLNNFRNFDTAILDLGERFTVLHGHNGAGKTNLLEAIYLIGTLRSFRTNDMGAMIRHEFEATSVEAVVSDSVAGVPSSLAVQIRRHATSVRRTASVDRKTIRSAADFYGRLPVILFTPEDLAVLRGAPAGRRQLIDRMLFVRDRGHIQDIQAYEKLVRSRNHVLRGETPAKDRAQLLDTYDAGIAQVGARIWERRTTFIEQLQGPFSRAFARIHGQRGSTPAEGNASSAHLSYAARWEAKQGAVQESLLDGLRRARGTDLRRGTTSVGPHRDDVVVELDGKPAGQFASQGQARALVLAIKLAELDLARDLAPILLLDDVSSELDPARAVLLTQSLMDAADQCLLTTTSPSFVPLPSTTQVRHYRVDLGRLEVTPKALN